METQDYFQILRVQKGARPAEIQRAFHKSSRAYHPDRYYQLPDLALKEKINRVYKRMTEAYFVLRDEAKRVRYVAEIEGPERDKKLRFSEASETEIKLAAKKQAEEEIGTTPKGRQFYAAGTAEMEAGRWSAAERSLKMAVTYEPANALYKEKLAEAQQKLYEEMKQKGEPFKIK
jgi:DnaJ-class molecular chaperone